MARTPEAKLKAQVKNFLDYLGLWRAGGPKPERITGWYYMPVQDGRGVVGIPDFICCYKGWFLAIETKAPNGVVSPNQQRRQEEITAAGGKALVIRDIRELEELFRYEIREEEDEEEYEQGRTKKSCLR